MTEYNKLVRDKIPEIIESKGEPVKFHVAAEAEYWEKLKEKFSEETAEFIKEANPEEMADVLEIIDAIIDCRRFDREEIELIKKEKASKRGRFEKRIILEEA